MGRYTKLLINREQVEKAINEYCNAIDSSYKMSEPKIINASTGQTRYTIKITGNAYDIDIYYRSDNKTTIQPMGNAENKKWGSELAEYILNSLDYSEIESGTITIKTTEEIYDHLITYLSSIEGVKNVKNENNDTLKINQFLSDIGDKVTLTFYKTTKKLLFQGYLLKLYSEVKCFLNPFEVEIKTTYEGKIIESDSVQTRLEKALPNSFNKIDKILVEYVYDSFAQICNNIKCNDYSVWTFSALKGLEAFIKQLLLVESIQIIDEKGFSLGFRKPIFIKDRNDDYIINNRIVNISDATMIVAIEECYNYFASKRHVFFHTKQAISATKRIKNPSEAEDIVNNVCTLFEKYYTLIV